MTRTAILGITAVAVAVVAITPPASARQLKDRSCVSACRGPRKTCLESARTQAHLCVDTECSDELAAVREACAADEGAPACTEARATLYPCLSPCRQSMRDDLRQCRTDVADCVAVCPDSEPPHQPGDRACLRDCRDGLGLCLGDARAQSHQCREDCAPIAEEAGAACGNGRPQTCRTARLAASDCVFQCRDALGDPTAACLRTSRECVAQCADTSPSAGND